MGMTIDEAIVDIKDNIKPVVGGISLDMAIDTMRKYQKIEEILDDCDLEAWEVLEKIKEVVKDGRD